MKKFNTIWSVALCAAAVAMVSCDNSDDDVADYSSSLTTAQSGFVTSYVDNVVVARYSQLATDGKTLLESAQAIQSSTATDKTSLIAEAAEAWIAARVSWERTEAYLFGPVDKAGIDPGIDSWPLSLPELQEKIQGWSESDNYLAADGGDLKGFHAIEYVLFADGAAKSTSVTNFSSAYSISQGSLSDEAFEDNIESYLVAVCNELYRCVLQLEAEWNLSGLSTEKLADYNEFGSQITLNTAGGNYGDIFKTPGLDNAYYSSFNACVSEALLGMIGIADEVANVKISDPIDAESESAGTGLLEVESWFSYNSISDFTNNVRGIKEAYVGELCAVEGTFDISTTPATYSLGYMLEAINPTKAAEVVTALNTAISVVENMPAPFRDNLLESYNATAVAAVQAVQEVLEEAYTILLNEEVPEEDEE